MVRANHIIVRWSIDGGGQPLSPCIITTAPHRLSSSSSVEEEEDVRDKNEHNRRTDVQYRVLYRPTPYYGVGTKQSPLRFTEPK